jgi:hypothetical protein
MILKSTLLAFTINALSIAVAISQDTAFVDNGLCVAKCDEGKCTFQFVLDIYASSTGYFKVKGCESLGPQPTLGMKRNTKYIFDQSDETNWFHPLGFAYAEDGVYAENDELEKVVAEPKSTDSTCALNATCQAPIYSLNGQALCDAKAEDPSAECDPEDFGLDQYEGVFFSGGRDDWLDLQDPTLGGWTIDLTITDENTDELFYFCHIHNKMSARIEIVNDQNIPVSGDDIPISYEYEQPSEFDQTCGSYNAGPYANTAEACPGMTFICGAGESTQFDKCMAAINCAMHVEMRTPKRGESAATFMHQMIAHHENAVNMAKVLLKENPQSLDCGTAYDGRRRMEGCESDGSGDGGTPFRTLLWDIINTQNQQITFMRAWLKDNQRSASSFETCVVEDVVQGDSDEGNSSNLMSPVLFCATLLLLFLH